MSKNLKLVKRIAAVATAVCVVAGMMVSASAYGITEPAGGFVYDGTQESITVPVTGTNTSGQVTIVVRTEGDAWLTDPNANVVFIDQVTGADSSTSITFGIDSKWLSAPGTYKIYVGGSSQAVTSATLTIGGDPVELESIAVAADAKTAYTVGDTFVAPKVTGTYSNGSTATVDATFSGYDLSVEGTQTVTVTVGAISTTYEITVAPKAPAGSYIFGQVYDEAFDQEGKLVVDLTLPEGNGTKKVTVGGAELYYSIQKEIYVGLIDEDKLSGEELSDVVITAEEPTSFVYGNIDGDNEYDSIDEAVDGSDLQMLKLFIKGRTLSGAQLISADLDGDGLSDGSDLQALKLYIKTNREFSVLK